MTLPVRRLVEPEYKIAATTCDRMGIEVNIAEKDMTVSGHAPREPGRFTGEVTVTFQPDSLPPVRIPFNGVVLNAPVGN